TANPSAGVSHTLTIDQCKRLMSLLSDSDLGAIQHMTFTTTFLFNIIDVSHLDITMAHPNGTKAKVNQIESCKLNDNLIIHDVLVVPGYHVLRIDSLLKCQVGTSSEKDRLGHPADQVLSILKNDIDLKGNFSSEPCDVCHRAKHTREPFPLSDHKSKMVGQLVHLDVWGPYKFATVLNSTNKFSSRSEKCVFIGYSSDKKGNKLYSLDSRQFLFARDVKFYEIIYPFKNDSLTKEYLKEIESINNLNFFDIQRSNMPNDDVTDANEGGGTNPSSIDTAVKSADVDLSPTVEPSASTSNKGLDNSHSKVTSNVNSDLLGKITTQGSIDDGGAAPEEEINISEGDDLNIYDLDLLLQTDEGILEHSSVGGPQVVRKSNRKSVMPSKLNDYVINSKVKYGLDKYVKYLNLSSDNYSFVTNLNKTYEPKSYKEAVTDPRWIKAMNAEMEALIRNMT
ncbi:ribonuclease H-like domain-containing protein, partial [Tanacetum coccineum]